jgi:biopolymer transport protein ExbD
MAISVEGGGKSGRKSVSHELNLVPYIDLLTCMIAFLLITSIWTQLARLEVTQKGQGAETDGVSDPVPRRLAVLVGAEGFNVIVGEDQKPIPRRGAALDYARLVEALKVVKDTYPDASALQILSEDTMLFDSLVQTMDAAMAAGFPALSLLDARGQ